MNKQDLLEDEYVYLRYELAIESVEEIIKYVETNSRFNICYEFDHIEHENDIVDIVLNWRDDYKGGIK